MESEIRSEYNQRFTEEKYNSFKKHVSEVYNHSVKFRLCETPVFLSAEIRRMLLEACEEINDVLVKPNFKELTNGAIKDSSLFAPNEDEHTRFLVMDFGICKGADGKLIPQLIELQGFPSLYFFQEMLANAYRKHMYVPEGYTTHFDGLDSAGYMEVMRQAVVGNCNPKNVVLLEIEPEKQATSIDFYAAEKELGIKVLCISKLIKQGRKLFYSADDGELIQVERIFNRVIFDELVQRDDLKREFQFTDEVDVEWVGHPNWFFRISKYTMPLLSGKYVPECNYLDQLAKYPDDLENYVLKPLFSFAGTGVKLHIIRADLDEIKDRDNYILQRKVVYEPLIQTPTGPAKFEVRMLMVWDKGAPRMRVVNNLVRVSKGEMIGVRYNKDKDWVGASVAFFKT
jgi:hypothetical protein